MWLTYLEAHRQLESGKLTWNEYIDHLMARCTGGGHIDDEREGIQYELKNTDPFGYTMWCWTGRYLLEDATPIKAVFTSFRTDSIEEFREKLTALRKDYAPDVRRSVALLALQERRANVLQLCFEEPFPYSSGFEDEADRVDEHKNPDTFQVLEESHFRRIYPRKPPRIRANSKDGTYGDDNDEKDKDTNPAAVFDAGGRYPVDW